MPYDSIPARFLAQAEQRPDRPAYYVRRGGNWLATSWRTYVDEVRTAARALIGLGFQPGHTVCILGFNRPEWVIADMAAMCAGGVPAGIYTTCSPEEVQYIVHHAESGIVFLEDASQWEKIKAQRANLPLLRHVVMFKDAPAIDDALVMSWEQFVAKAEGVDAGEIDARVAALEASQNATLIYTSGTTGPPKAVTLTHENLAWTSKSGLKVVDANDTDSNLSYLPLSHIAEQVFTIHIPATVGSQVYFAEDFAKVADNLKEVQPTLVFGVPRVWEKFYAGVSAKLAQATGLKARLAAWAQDVGRRANDVKNRGGQPSGLLALQYRLADKLIYSKIKPALGLGNLRFGVSGAAPIAKEILEFFAGLDIMIYEVYGQSEDTGPTTFNLPGRTRFGTVGPPFPGVEVKIAEDGEILVRGPNVFKGYLKDQAATDEALIDGWLHSGDLGAFDQDGFLSITGRKKEIIITAGGKNIAPKNIEAALKNFELVSQAVVIGDRRKYLTALVTLDPDAAKRFADEHGLPIVGIHADPKLRAALQSGVDEVNKLFARVEHVRKFQVVGEDFSVDGGELTPTMKIKRRVVNEKYAAQIEEMYAGDGD